MAIKIKYTNEVKNDGVKCLVYGKAGIGKTTLMATAPSPIVLSCESGLLSIADANLPYIEIETVDDIYEAYEYLVNGEGKDKYKTICLDSISEIAEVFLSTLKKRNKDARAAYGDLADDMGGMIRAFRDIRGKNVVFSAKRTRLTDDDTGVTSYVAAMPGKTLLNGLPFFFDEVFYMTKMQDSEGIDHRVIMTEAGFQYDAKDRSGKLNPIERPDLSYLFDKISGGDVEESSVKKEFVKHVEEEDENEGMLFWYHPESESFGAVKDRTELGHILENGGEEISSGQYAVLLARDEEPEEE